MKDIQDACKLFEPIYDQTDAADGYVSVEVSPRLADDTEGTVEAAKWLHKVVSRPNVYIKIPATAPCIPSIKEVIANGISVNVTVSQFYASFVIPCKSILCIFYYSLYFYYFFGWGLRFYASLVS